MSRRTLACAALLATALAGQPVVAGAEPLREFTAQRIDWKPCFPNGVPAELPAGSERLECGSFRAPLDWQHPDSGAEVTLAVTRLVPDGGTRNRALFTNPGGPGMPGRAVPLGFLGANRTELLRTHDIYGLDVRGVGDSTALSCGEPVDSAPIDPRDRSPENEQRMLASTVDLARRCQQAGGDLGRHVTTEQTVRDVELLRVLTGHERVDYWGMSAGAWLGAHYASRFPQHTGHFVLDSNPDFTESWQKLMRTQAIGVERAWRERFAPWAARHHARFGLGATPEEVIASYERVRAQLGEHPAAGPEGTPVIDASTVDSLIRDGMYEKGMFVKLGNVLGRFRAWAGSPPGAARDLALRNAVDAARADDRATPTPPSSDSTAATSQAIVCNDRAFRGTPRDALRDSAALGRDHPVWGWYSYGTASCMDQNWERPGEDLAVPDGEGLPPTLMLQATHDPATPWIGARHAHEHFAGSRMITVHDESDHGVYGNHNACVDGRTDAFLVHGVVPDGDLSCPAVPLPEPGESVPRDLAGWIAHTGLAAGALPK